MEMKPVGKTVTKTIQVEVEVPVEIPAQPKKKKGGLFAHLKSIGYTNRLGTHIMLMLWAGLAGSFILAWRSITYQYMGALACWTVVFTPIGTASSIVLGAIVNKNKAENTSADGDGIVYASAQSKNFNNQDYVGNDSPPI